MRFFCYNNLVISLVLLFIQLRIQISRKKIALSSILLLSTEEIFQEGGKLKGKYQDLPVCSTLSYYPVDQFFSWWEKLNRKRSPLQNIFPNFFSLSFDRSLLHSLKRMHLINCSQRREEEEEVVELIVSWIFQREISRVIIFFINLRVSQL